MQYGAYTGTLTAATDTTVGGVLKLQNPEGVDLLVTLLALDITTPSSGAAAVDAGIDDDGATNSDILLDGASVATAAKVLDSIKDAGTNGTVVVKWPATHYLVITASATTAGMVGRYYIQYIRVAS